jgi:hypothetical protein
MRIDLCLDDSLGLALQERFLLGHLCSLSGPHSSKLKLETRKTMNADL